MQVVPCGSINYASRTSARNRRMGKASVRQDDPRARSSRGGLRTTAAWRMHSAQRAHHNDYSPRKIEKMPSFWTIFATIHFNQTASELHPHRGGGAFPGSQRLYLEWVRFRIQSGGGSVPLGDSSVMPGPAVSIEMPGLNVPPHFKHFGVRRQSGAVQSGPSYVHYP